jgi:hypothetical protein
MALHLFVFCSASVVVDLQVWVWQPSPAVPWARLRAPSPTVRMDTHFYCRGRSLETTIFVFVFLGKYFLLTFLHNTKKEVMQKLKLKVTFAKVVAKIHARYLLIQQ